MPSERTTLTLQGGSYVTIVYVARRRIAPSYLFDAAPQIAISTPLLRSQARFGAAA